LSAAKCTLILRSSDLSLIRPAFTRPAFTRPAFTRPAFIRPAFTRPAFTRPAFIRPAFTRPAFTRPAFIRPAFTCAAFIRPAFIRPAFIRPAFTRSAFICPAFTRPAFIRPAFIRPAFTCAAFIPPAFIRPAFIRPAFTRSAFIRPAFIRPAFIPPAFIPPAFIPPAFLTDRMFFYLNLFSLLHPSKITSVAKTDCVATTASSIRKYVHYARTHRMRSSDSSLNEGLQCMRKKCCLHCYRVLHPGMLAAASTRWSPQDSIEQDASGHMTCRILPREIQPVGVVIRRGRLTNFFPQSFPAPTGRRRWLEPQSSPRDRR
uniref:Uncharacterized protein n=1 Tax=Leptobrachium leishanense TaxID=445787 RepID=A0A8C5MPQ7_9ANUR